MLFKKNLNFKLAILFCCISACSSTYAQGKSKSQLDSLYNLMIRQTQVSDIKSASPSVAAEPVKCGFPLAAEVRGNMEYFTAEQQVELKKIMSRPTTETSIVSPSGFFRIHFNLTGLVTPDYVTSSTASENAQYVAEALDSAYNFEVNYLGYSSPPSDNGEGGDNLYDVYIVNKGSTYGETHPGSTIDNKTDSYITIDNDYNSGFYTYGLDAMRVTVAHELHHAVQLAYVYRESDIYFMEITSTSMEEFVFDDVNDYYQYMKNYFNNTSRVFSRKSTGSDSYDFAIWNLFLADTLGIEIIKRQWELMPDMNALEAIQQSLIDKGTTFFDMMNQFGIWCYFTGYRAQEGKYFEEAANYPVVKPINSMDLNVPINTTYKLQAHPPLANAYITFAESDSLTTMISNSNWRAALETPTIVYTFNYTLFNYEADGASKLTSKYFYSFDPNNQYWSTAEMFSDQLIREGYIIEQKPDFAYPSPFFYSNHSQIYIPTEKNLYEVSYLNVYSSSMDLVYSASKTAIFKYGQYSIPWDGKNINGEKLSTGIYIYILKTGDNSVVGKIAIFNE